MSYSHLQLIDVWDVEEIVNDHLFVPGEECVPLGQAAGRVLAEDVFCDRDQPPFDRVMMDGIAFSSAAWQTENRTFLVEGSQSAGMPRQRRARPEGCFEVMTGAVLPEGCDCVVPVEEVSFSQGQAQVAVGLKCVPYDNVHRQGVDLAQGALVLPRGTVLAASQIAALATVGKAAVNVARLPRIAVLSSGDELVDFDKDPLTHQLRSSNALALSVLLGRHGLGRPEIFHLPDDKTQIRCSLARILAQADIIVSSGGVSKGRSDLIAQVVSDLGGKLLIHGVKERPGKPLLFCLLPGAKSFFGLPGNPVSTLVTAVRYVIPYLKRSLGQDVVPGRISIDQDFVPPLDLTYFLPVKKNPEPIQEDQGKLVGFSCSGDLFALARADGFVELSRGERSFPKNSRVPYYEF